MPLTYNVQGCKFATTQTQIFSNMAYAINLSHVQTVTEQLHTDLDEATEDWAEASEALEELEREQESC